MRIFVVDASVVIRWFFASPDTAAAVALLEKQWAYVAPDSLVSDLGRVIWRRVRRGSLQPATAQRLVTDLATIAVDTVPCRALATDASAIAALAGRPFGDALYLALAARLQTQLISADTRLLRGVAATPLLASLVRDVREWVGPSEAAGSPPLALDGDISAAAVDGA